MVGYAAELVIRALNLLVVSRPAILPLVAVEIVIVGSAPPGPGNRESGATT
jgi:hypothetical protein